MTEIPDPVRIVIRAGKPGTATYVTFEVNRQFLWYGDRTYILKRGTFRTNEDFLRVVEGARPLVFAMLDAPDATYVDGLILGSSLVGFDLFPAAAGLLEFYVDKMRMLLDDAFGLNGVIAHLITEEFGPPRSVSATIEAIKTGWGDGIIAVKDDEELAKEIRAAQKA